jgi:large subunit ribosomal protein L5
MNRLRQKYQQEIVPALQKELGIKNVNAVPKIEKIILNVGVTDAERRDMAIENVSQWIGLITGQKPKVSSARISIAGFKLRAGDPVGVTVTLRGEKMYQFIDRVISIVLPRVKDFQGVSTTAFDHAGNYSLGLKEQIVFPEIDYDKIDRVRGLQINIVTSTNNPKHARTLLEKLGMPFKKEE